MLNKDSQSDMGKNCFQDNRRVAEGYIGGGLISALILCKTMTIFFSGSDSEISYGSTRLSPILYQDDSARFCTRIEEAEKGNIWRGSSSIVWSDLGPLQNPPPPLWSRVIIWHTPLPATIDRTLLELEWKVKIIEMRYGFVREFIYFNNFGPLMKWSSDHLVYQFTNLFTL